MKRLVVALAALLVLAASDNPAVAINTKDNSTLIKISFKITRVNGDVVSPTNLAFAYASCTSCETVAIAIQGVLIMGTDATTVTPTNEAWAFNYLCNYCQTLADAYQFTYTESGPVHFTPEGQKEIAEIRRQLEAIKHSDMSLLEIVAAVDALANELNHVLATQVVPSGNSGQSPAQPSPAPSASPSPGGSPSPSASPSAAPSSPSPTTSPAPSP